LGLGHFDLVICDLILPHRGGAEVIRALRARVPGVPILVISGAWHALDAVQSLESCPSVMTLKKPFTFEALVAFVDKLSSDQVSRGQLN
jgi:two-component system cell cycle sensor histidine kinase/response regulator CckA